MVSNTSSLASSLSDELLDPPLIRRLPAELFDYLLYDKIARNRRKLGILNTRRLLELCTRLGIRRNQLWAGSKRREVTADSAGFEQLKPVILGYVWHLTERLVLEVGRLLVLSRREVDGNELVGNVALFGYEGHTTRANRPWISMKFECHGELSLRRKWDAPHD